MEIMENGEGFGEKTKTNLLYLYLLMKMNEVEQWIKIMKKVCIHPN